MRRPTRPAGLPDSLTRAARLGPGARGPAARRSDARAELHAIVVEAFSGLTSEQVIARLRWWLEETRPGLLIRTVLTEDEMACCSVEDSGPGIDLAHLPHLFDSFFTTKDSGIGLGLAISRSIIETHGGHIQADNDSALGGARFSFVLPVGTD